jgi:hypothetical protein
MCVVLDDGVFALEDLDLHLTVSQEFVRGKHDET